MCSFDFLTVSQHVQNPLHFLGKHERHVISLVNFSLTF